MPEKSGAEILADALDELNMSRNTRDIVDQVFVFRGNGGDHIVCGSVTSIGFAPDHGIRLYVSCKKFHGHEIVAFEPAHSSFGYLILQSAENEQTRFSGSYEILIRE